MEPLARAIEAGTIEVVWQSSVEAKVDIVAANLVSTFDALEPRRVVVDGMHGFQVTEDHAERIQDFFAALSDFFIARGATLVFTAESADFVGEPLRPPFANASRMCHNIITLRFSEVASRIMRAIAVIKTRDASLDGEIHEFTITDRGLEIAGPIAGRDKLLVGQSRSSQG
jgi:KaiC/GvpD/RAD55 family RecA-like ATPase